MLLAASLLLAALPQDPAPAPQEPADAGNVGLVGEEDWITVNFVAIHAGERIVTLREYEEMVERVARSQGIVPQDPAYAQMAGELFREISISELAPQAGADLGLAPEQIDRIVLGGIEDNRRQFGSAGLADVLAEDGLSFQSFRESRQTRLLRDVWEKENLGDQNLPMRPRRDAFIRPGITRALYATDSERLYPVTVTLQLIQARLVFYDDDEEAGREYLEEARRRALDGADFNQLVQEYSAPVPPNGGFVPPYKLYELRYPELRAWAETAPEGAVGPVMALEQGGDRMLVIPRMDRREGGEVPPYTDRETQELLRQEALREWRGSILGYEQGRLLQSSFVWIDPNLRFLLDRASPPPGAAAPQTP